MIGSYELRIKELGRRLRGDQERMRLIEQMQVDLDFHRIRALDHGSMLEQEAGTGWKGAQTYSLSTELSPEFYSTS